MKAVVTGAGGFVGSHLVRLLLDRTDWEVVATLRSSASRLPYLSGHRHLRYLYQDLCFGLVDVEDVDLIFSLAATADPKWALTVPGEALRNGVGVMTATMDCARRTGARVLHVSTNEVYGTGGGLPLAPRGPYAAAKACQELVRTAYPDVRMEIVVTQSLFGERQQVDHLVPTVLRKLFAGETIGLQAAGGVVASRPWFHVANLCDALLHEAAKPASVLYGKRSHCGSAEQVSNERLVLSLAELVNKEAKIVQVPAGDRAGHELAPDVIGCDVRDWSPCISLAQGLERTAEFYLEHPEWL